MPRPSHLPPPPQELTAFRAWLRRKGVTQAQVQALFAQPARSRREVVGRVRDLVLSLPGAKKEKER